jgi:hypothetical protein
VGVANVFTKSQVFHPDSDGISVVARRFGTSQSALLVDFQTQANAHLAGIDKDGKIDTPAVTLGTVSSATGALKLAHASSANLTTLQAGNAAAAVTYTWPTNVGAAGAALVDTAGNGTLAWTVPTANATAASAPVDAVAATAAISSSGVDVTAADWVIIAGKTYTFVSPVGTTEGNVLVGGTSDASLTNLINAINHTGTPNTDYFCAAVHSTVSAGTLGVNTFTLTAKTKGVVGNAYSMSKSAATLTVDALFTNGIDGTAGVVGQVIVAGGTQPYMCLATATTATSGAWKKVTVASL